MSGMMRVGVFNYDYFEIHFFFKYTYIYIYTYIIIYLYIICLNDLTYLFSLGCPGAGGDRRLGNGERYALAVRGGCKDSR